MNPYAAPSVQHDAVVPAVDAPFAVVARNIFVQWEKLRLLYLAALSCFCILIVGPSRLTSNNVIGVLITGAIAANILYFAGPVVEAYVAWLGYRPKWFRWLLFVGGTLLSAFVAFVSLFGAMLAHLD
jgi:hypothetical protein